MERKDALRAMRQGAKGLGFTHKAPHFWKPVEDFLLVTNLQGSRWSHGKYVNVGFIPACLVVKPVPPHNGCWALCLRASEIPSPHEALFNRLEEDDEDLITPDELVEPMRWLFEWQMKEWHSFEAIKVITEKYSSLYTKYVHVKLKDWVRGELKTPAEYGSDPQYYGTS